MASGSVVIERRPAVAGIALFCLLALVTPAAATTYNVATVADLTSAVDAVNAGNGGDIIIVAPGLYQLTQGLNLWVAVSVVGDPTAPTIIDASTPGYAFENYGSGARLYDLTIQNALTAVINAGDGSLFGTGLTITGGQLGVYAGDSGATTTLTNSTITGNSDDGILLQCAYLNLVNVTVTNNLDGIFVDFACGETMQLINSIVAGNTHSDCRGGGITPDGIASIDGDGTCGAMGFGATVTTQPASAIGLGALAANGGPTMTLAIPATSVAADAGDTTRCPATDQRGLARSDGACDIGAYEAGATAAAAGNTPAGTDVALSPAPGVTITLPLVVTGGNTTVTTLGAGVPPVPGGFQIDGAVYDITTTALFAGNATVCLPYDPAVDPNPLLYHYQAQPAPASWVNVTVSTDAVAHVVCGAVSSFSPFAVMSYASGAGDVGDTLMVTVDSAIDHLFALSWSPSCAAADADYDVYMGTIGSWYSHVPVACGTGGRTSTGVFADGNQYFLVVPRNPAYEGVYGSSSAGVPIPQPASACAVQVVAPTCP